jgi:hypothetical protein
MTNQEKNKLAVKKYTFLLLKVSAILFNNKTKIKPKHIITF